MKRMNKIFNGYMNWALVTGAASGMGRVYVRRLAMMGYNIIAVDINADGLEETAAVVRAEASRAARAAPASSSSAVRSRIICRSSLKICACRRSGTTARAAIT